ncbi:Cartilage matrix protein [Mizuhopecten yessoensis]|uniref:Cartilage matrix protein n=1 Tax=Mizuhopecten yessoensis TaxID=6573 RepID=A0A210QI97_MIZYE|nr:Cartilage matrix protein [Mizuhopecten yessoensis]
MWSPILIVMAILLMFGVDAAPQPTAVTQCAPMDVVFLLDSSKSVRGQDFDKQLKFANDIVDRLDVGPGPNQTRVGVISIGYTYLLQFYLQTHKTREDVKTAISHIRHRFSYETNTGASIRFMTRYMFRPFFGGRPGATRVAIVITDGLSQDQKSTRFEALLARKKGIKMFAIGVGLKKESELLSIGNWPTDDYVFKVDSFDALPSVIFNLPKSSCEVAAMTTQRPVPTKRFTLAPLIFNTLKFVPPKTRAPMTPALSSDKQTYRNSLFPVVRDYKLRGQYLSKTTTNPQSTIAPTNRGPYPAGSTTNPPSTPAPTTRGSDLTNSTTNPPSTPAPTTHGLDLTDSTTNPPSTPAPTTRGSDLTDSTTNPPSTPSPTSHGSDLTDSTTNLPSTPAPTTRGSDLTDSTTNPPSTPAPTTHGSDLTDSTTNPPSTPAPTTRGSNLTDSTTNPPSTPAPTTRSASSSDSTTVFSSTKSPSTSDSSTKSSHQPQEPVSDAPFSVEQAPEDLFALDNLSNKLSRDVAIADEPKQYCGGKNADVFFALDSSNSIWPEDFKKQLQFVTDLVDTFDFRNNKTRVGIIVYSTDIHMKVALQSGWTKEQIKRQISNIEYVSGLTNTSDAIRFIRSYGFTEANEREDTIKIAIILTDGISRDPLATKRESVLSREEGIKLFAIGIGKDIQRTELKRIANDPDDKYVFNVSSFDALASIRSIVAVSACGVVPDQPSNLLYCGADSLADVIFVYDAAGLGARKARLLTSFVHDVKRGLQTAPDGLRIGRRSDNCPSNSNIDLTTDTNLRAFNSIQFPGIETLLGQLRMVFPNRLDAKNLAVVFVDESTQNIELATRVLKGDVNFHVMVVAIGDLSLARLASDLASLPHNDYLMNVPSYMSLGAYRYEFLQKLCYLITNEPMYLRDARVRETRNL